jgi:rod shape-determining protein MreD
MRFLFYLIVSLMVIVFQTTLLPGFSFFGHLFDLTLVVVLSISLAFSSFWLLTGVFALGCVMDTLSGGPFGLFLSVYSWVFVLVQVCKRFVHSENIIFLFVISGGAVFLENGFQIFTFLAHGGDAAVLAADIKAMVWQVVWAFAVLPAAMVVLSLAERVFLRFMAKRLGSLKRV